MKTIDLKGEARWLTSWTLEVSRLQYLCSDPCIRNLPPAIFDRTATTILLEANVMPCPQCGGHKEVPHPDDDGQEGDWRWIPCPTCYDAVSALGQAITDFTFASLMSRNEYLEGEFNRIEQVRAGSHRMQGQLAEATVEIKTLQGQLRRLKGVE